MPRRIPTTQQVKRVYVLAPDNLARDGKQEWGMEADEQFDAWYEAARRDAVVAFAESVATYWDTLGYGKDWVRALRGFASGDLPIPRTTSSDARPGGGV